MHRPIKNLSAEALVRVVFTAIVLLPPQSTLAVSNSHPDPDQVTITLMAQDIHPIEPFRGVERG